MCEGFKFVFEDIQFHNICGTTITANGSSEAASDRRWQGVTEREGVMIGMRSYVITSHWMIPNV